jgi:hypothetical protein
MNRAWAHAGDTLYGRIKLYLWGAGIVWWLGEMLLNLWHMIFG